MKKILGVLLINLIFFSTGLRSQVTVESFPMNPQSGSHNYFGVRVTLAQTYTENVTVTGYIYDMGGGANTNTPFSLTITAGDLTAETAPNFYQTDPTATAETALGTIATVYAGVTVTFLANENILKFNSTLDANAVLDQLDNDYETHNTNYENQYPTLTAEQLDDMDIQTGFDQFKTFRDFENLFTGYSSKRVEVENIEIAWLNNSFSGISPDDNDFTYDDAMNTIFNSNYSFKVGNDLYHLTILGIYINSVLHDEGGNTQLRNGEKKFYFASEVLIHQPPVSGPMIEFYDEYLYTICKSNKRKKGEEVYNNNANKFELKVAVLSIGIRSAIKAKILHFKLKNNGNGYKRSRTTMAVGYGGTVYDGNCSNSFPALDRKPYSGYLKRNEVKQKIHTRNPVGGNATIWKVYSGQFSGSFETPGALSGVLPLTF